MINNRIPLRARKPLFWLGVAITLVVVLRLTVMAPASIHTVTITKRDLSSQVYGNGTVETKVSVSVSSKVTGRIEILYADQGDTVKAGQVLAELEDEDYRQQVLEAEAGVWKSEAARAAAIADNLKALANLDLVRKNYERAEGLAARSLISQQALDEQAATLDIAEREVERSRSAIEAADKDLLARRANLAFTKSRKDDMVVSAPNDGIIISRNLEVGATVAPGFPIFRIADPSVIWVTAYIDESHCRELAVGQPAGIYLRSSPGKKLSGRVARIGLESDRVTEEIEVDVAFDTTLPGFRIGEQAEVYITTGAKLGSPALPANAVFSKGKQKSIWIIKDGKLRAKEIVAGIEDRTGFVEIISGVDAQTLVAVAPPPVMIGFKDGMRVKVAR